MATLRSLTEFNGSVGNLSAYKRKDSDKVILRAKGGASKSKIKRSDSFKKTRQLNAEWGGCSKAATQVRNLFNGLQHVADFNLSAQLTGLAKLIQSRDTEHAQGERSVLFSQHASLLEGFQLNRKTSVEAVLRLGLESRISRTEQKAWVEIPELIPGINFHTPASYPLFRISAGFVTVRDHHYSPSGYITRGEGLQQIGDAYLSNWYYTAEPLAAQSIALNCQTPNYLQDDDAFLLTIAIEFGTPITDQIVQQAKYVGCGKILKVG